MYVPQKPKKESVLERRERLKARRKAIEKERNTVFKKRSALVSHNDIDKTANTLDTLINKNKVRIDLWQSLEEDDKVIALGYYVKHYTTFKAFTVRMSPNFILKMKQSENWADFIRRRLNMNFKRKLGFHPDYAFVIEQDNNGTEHLHGMININAIPEDTVRDIFKLTLFGADYKEASINRHLWRLQDMTDPLGWATYCLKDYSGDKTHIYISNHLRNFVQESIIRSLQFKEPIMVRLKRLLEEDRKLKEASKTNE